MSENINLERLLRACRFFGALGLGNKRNAFIPQLEIDVVNSSVFLGTNNNPAIFVSEITYRKLKRFHKNWIPNVTIAIREAFINRSNKMSIVGAIIHEAGHAFNVYGKIINTELNAYIFEIEVLLKLYSKNILSKQYHLGFNDLRQYFQSRLAYYNINKSQNQYFDKLIDNISKHFRLDEKKQLTDKKCFGYCQGIFSKKEIIKDKNRYIDESFFIKSSL